MIKYVNHLGEVRPIQDDSPTLNVAAKVFSFNEPTGVSDVRLIYSSPSTYPGKGLSTVFMNPKHVFSVRQEITENTKKITDISEFTDVLFE